MASKKTNDRRAAVLRCIVGHIAAFSRPPTVQEITDALNIGSKSTTAADLAWLEAQGRITVDRGVARGITVLTR